MRRGAPEPSPPSPLPRQRLDLWLWHARFLRSRKACAQLVQAGYVRVNGMRVTQPGHALKIGDVLTLALGARTRVLAVEAFAEKRGGPADAPRLFRPLDAQM